MFKVHRKKKQHRGIRKYRKGRLFKVVKPRRFPCASLNDIQVEKLWRQSGIAVGMPFEHLGTNRDERV